MTPAGEQLCYTDAYARTVEARVAAVEAGEATLVVLDRTVFYPGGGGQPSDRGLILRAGDGDRGPSAARARPVARSSTSSSPTTATRRRSATSSRSTSTGRAAWP